MKNYIVLEYILDRLTRPNIIDIWSMIFIGISCVVSGIAIFTAIRVPKKIAEKQNKIALFDKRMDIFLAVYDMHKFSKRICNYNFDDINIIHHNRKSDMALINREYFKEINDQVIERACLKINEMSRDAVSFEFLFKGVTEDTAKMVLSASKICTAFFREGKQPEIDDKLVVLAYKDDEIDKMSKYLIIQD